MATSDPSKQTDPASEVTSEPETIDMLRQRIAQLEQRVACGDAMLERVEGGVLLVDPDLRVRRFNSAIKSAFALRLEDVGRHLAEVAYALEAQEEMLDDVRRVLETGLRMERETRHIDGRFYRKLISATRDSAGKIDGVLLSFVDVTATRALEARFEFALQSAGLSWWDWKLPDGKIEVTSAGACLLGRNCLTVERDSEAWIRVVHPNDQAEVRRTLNDCISGKSEEWSCEHRFLTDTGVWLWVRNQGVVTERDVNGNPRKMMGTTQNIDSLKKALIEAGKQREILEAADEISKVGAWDYDPETRQVTWSAQTRKILEVGERIEPSTEVTYDMMPPVDREVLQNAFEKLAEDGTPYDLELHFTSAKGKELLCRSAGRASFGENGKINRVFGIFQDITESTQVKHEMEAFFHLAPGFQATVGMDGVFKSWSSGWSRNLDYSDEELRGMPLDRVIHQADRSAFEEMFAKAVSGQTVTDFETRVCPRPGAHGECNAGEVWLSWNFSSDPELLLVFVSARCVTEQKETQRKLAAEHMRAEQANRAKNEFLAVMSHELRTPLNPVIGFAEILLGEVQDEEQKEMIQTIIESGDHMLALVDDILDFSKIEAGKTKLDPIDFSLESLVEGKIRMMSGMIRNNPIKLYHEIDWGPFSEGPKPTFRGDLNMIRQVLQNLLSNAIKYTESGRIDLFVSIAQGGKGAVDVEFAVKDTGIGIPKAEQGNLFEPFTQVNMGSTREFGGVGLGLAICKRIADLMDATITVQSEEGEGSCFTFTVPLAFQSGSDVPDPVDDATDDPTEKRDETAASEKVLVVEDNPTNAFFMKQLLRGLKVEMELVSNGETALQILAEQSFRLVFLDLHMPGIGGLETLKRLRAAKKIKGAKSIPVYVLTADTSKKAREQCEQIGCNGFLTKPVPVNEIKRILEACLVQT
jgi:PAS domain S-box-containing protein